MKLFECLILGTLLAAFPVVLSIPDKPAPPEPAIIEYAVITNIHDGDTVSIQFTKEYPIRLLNCWAPEITGKEKVKWRCYLRRSIEMKPK